MKGRDKKEKFSKSAAKGLTILIFLILFAQIVYFIWGEFSKRKKNTGETWFVELDSLRRDSILPDGTVFAGSSGRTGGSYNGASGTDGLYGRTSATGGNSEKAARKAPEYFNFDPNTVTKEELEKLGLTSRQAQTVLNYREKGGKFRRPADFSKIYVITDSMYKALEPYIVIGQTEVNSSSQTKGLSSGNTSSGAKPSEPGLSGDYSVYTRAPDNEFSVVKTSDNKSSDLSTSEIRSSTTKESQSESANPSDRRLEDNIIDLNTADSLALLSLYGIGPYYASKILQYRSNLGSFHSTEQLMEIRGIDSERFEGFRERIRIDSAAITPLDLYKMSPEELSAHPYIGSYAARGIIRLREITPKENFRPEMLLENKILTEEKYNRLLKYLRVNSDNDNEE